MLSVKYLGFRVFLRRVYYFKLENYTLVAELFLTIRNFTLKLGLFYKSKVLIVNFCLSHLLKLIVKNS